MVGSCDGRYACQCHVAVTVAGDVVPCLFMRDMIAGNVYREDVQAIVHRSKDMLLLRQPVTGAWASCQDATWCIGCRANALLYLGDATAADPKCFFNPASPERCADRDRGAARDERRGKKEKTGMP